MIEKLVCDFFIKIEEKEFKKSKNAKATFWVDELLEDYKLSNYISVKTATRLYNKYVDKKTDESVGEPDTILRNMMAQYLGYKDFDNFVLNNSTSELIKAEKKTKKRNKKLILFSFVLITTFTISLYVFSKNEVKNCIVWQGSKFVPSNCSQAESINNQLYHINIQKFEKIKVDLNTIFFKNGTAVIWYGKNVKGTIEYFSFRGIHPETLKPLKPITRYILKKEKLLIE